jgi:hypothetical protein
VNGASEKKNPGNQYQNLLQRNLHKKFHKDRLTAIIQRSGSIKADIENLELICFFGKDSTRDG